MPIALRYALAWLLLMVLGIANGILRGTTYQRVLPELLAHQISTVIAAVVIGWAISLVVRRWPPASDGEALALGAMWVAMTVSFEFLFGHFVDRLEWSRLLRDYDLRAGRLWSLFLLWLGLAPWWFRRRRTRATAA